MALNFQLDEATAAQRRFPLYLVDATDGITAETGEGGGQPQISKNGAAFGNTTATLTAIGNGSYYVELTAGELDTLGMVTIRFKSANTAEFSLTGQVVAYDPYAAYALASIATETRLAELDAGNLPTDIANVQSDTDDIQTRLPAALNGGRMDSDIGALGGVVQSLTDLKDFADAGYDPATDKVQGVVLVDTTTANSDMRGTENAALASVLGALADVAADGDPTAVDTLMQYVKQLVNVLVGTAGVVAYPAAAAPGNGVSLAEVLREVFDDVTGLNGDAMRGTNSAALATVATEARLSELDAGTAGKMANQVDLIEGDTTANLDATVSSRAVAGDAMALTAGAVDDVWNEDATGHQGAGTFGETIGDSAATGVTIHGRVNQALPAVAPAANGGLPTVDAANLIAGIQGAKNDFDDLNDVSTAQVNTEVDNAIGDARLDELIAATAGAVDPVIGSIADQMMNADGGQTFAQATDSLEAAANAVAALNDLSQADILNDATPFPGASITEARLAELDGANLPTDVANVQADTDDIQTRLPAALVGGAMDADVSNIQANAIDAAALALDAGQEIADRMLSRSLATGADGGRTVQDALRTARNRREIAAGTLTVYEEDDATPAWTGAVTTAAGDPIVEVAPA